MLNLPPQGQASLFCILCLMELKEHDIISIYCSKCGYPHQVVLYCGDRLCEVCKRRNYARLVNRYLPVLTRIPNNRVSQITLTYKNFKYLNTSQICSIKKDLITLRNSKLFKESVKGGLAVLEIKHVSDEVGWNLHIHMLVDAKYIPHRSLQEEWSKITGHSFIVHIKSERNTRNAFLHLLKYFLKTPIIKGSDVDDLREQYNNAFFGSRNVISFGSMYHSLSDNESKFSLKCPICGNIEWISEFELDKISRSASLFVDDV